MGQILVVCTGNVCRSPLIERALQRGLDQHHGPGRVTVTSAGTGALVDHEMDERSAVILRALGGDHEGFLARRLTAVHVRDADLVITATREHRSAAVSLVPRALRTAFTLRELAHLSSQIDIPSLPDDPTLRLRALAKEAAARRGSNAMLDPAELDVVDPYRRPDEVYDQMREQLGPALTQVLAVLAPPQQDGSAPDV